MEVTREQINEMIKARQGKRSLREFAKELKFSVAYLSDVLRNRRDPGPTLLTYLRLTSERSRTIRYFRMEPTETRRVRSRTGKE